VKRNYDGALESFRTLLERFPASPKVPDALLKVGLAQLEKKQKTEARATWRRLIEEHPGTNAATMARQRLDQLD
jgi:TolA-binding protein